jgi:hypothetical protein
MSRSLKRAWMVTAGLFVVAWVLTLSAVANGGSRFGVYALSFSTIVTSLTYAMMRRGGDRR